MFALTFLGTSASVPSAERNHPSLLVEAGGQRIMVDCGEGTQRQLLRSGSGFRRLDRLLLTHGHFDHVLGIPGLFSTLRLRQSADLMTIHGSPGTLDVVVRMLAGLWGEGRAPSRWSSSRWRKARSSTSTTSRSAAFRFGTATRTASDSRSKAARAVISGLTAWRLSAFRTVRRAGNWPKEGR
jgi:ribonuclease BN (tRNA processing enzyme)